MIYNISGEQPFQVLSDSFSVSPSQSGYDLYLSADGFNYSRFATVASGTTKQFTGMNNGNYYILSGNTSEVKANWERDCGGGGGAAGVSSLDGQTGALTTKTIGGQSILGTGDIPAGGGSNVYYVDGDSINSYSGIVDEIYHKLSSGETAYATVKYDYAKYPVAKAEIYEYQEGQPGDPDYLRQEGFQIIAARFGSDGYAIRSGIVKAFRYEGRDGNGYSCGQSWDYAMPEVSGGDYMIVEDLSAITSPTDGMIAYVPAHQETYSGLSIESSQIAYQAKLRKTAPREIDYNFSGAHNFDTNNPNSAPYDFDSDEQGNWHSIWDESVWLRYDSGQSRTYCVAKSGFTVICYLSSDYYEEITTAVTISPKTYIYRNGSWLRYEDGLVSFRLDTYATMDEWNTFISAITEFNAGEYQYVADEYYYGWSTHRFKTREKYDTNMSNGFGFAFECKASNAETFDNLQALNIKISNGSGWRAYDVAKYDFLNPPTNG